jgi:hypothetical protein
MDPKYLPESEKRKYEQRMKEYATIRDELKSRIHRTIRKLDRDNDIFNIITEHPWKAPLIYFIIRKLDDWISMRPLDYLFLNTEGYIA